MEVVLLGGDDRGVRALGDSASDLSFFSVFPLDFSVALARFDTLLVPCTTAFGFGGHVADRLLPLLGPNFSTRLGAEIENRFGGEQTKGSSFVIETGNERIPRACWTCVSALSERAPPDALAIYTATRAALLAVQAWNQKSSSPIRSIGIPLLANADQVGVDITQEVQQIVAAVRSVLSNRRAKPSSNAEVQKRLKELFEKPVRNFQSMLESGELSHRGIASESELNALIGFVREYERYPHAAAAAAEALAIAIREKKGAGPDCAEVQRRVCAKDGGCWSQLLGLVRNGKAIVHEEADLAELNIYEDNVSNSFSYGAYKGVAVAVRKFVLSPQIIPDPALLDSLVKDFRAQVAYFCVLKHPNLLPIAAAFTLSVESLIILRSCPRILSDVIADTSLPLDALRSGLPVAAVISFLHSVDVIHRDLKATCFVVGDTVEDIFLADFGSSDLFLRPSRTSPAHLPPEIVDQSSPRSAASDVYSLGVILWEMSVRREITATDLLAAAKDRNPTVRDVSGELGRLVKSCWEPRPNKRPTSAALHKEMVRLVGMQAATPAVTMTPAADERRAADRDTVQAMMQETDFAQIRAIISRLDPQISNNCAAGDAFDSIASLLEHYDVAVPVLSALIEKEIERTDSLAMCLRGDTTTIVLLARYFTYIGGPFLDRTLKPTLMSVLDIQLLLDPRALTAADSVADGTMTTEASRTTLKSLARTLFESLVRNAEVLPPPMHAIVRNLYAVLLKKWPCATIEEENKLATVAVTSTLFLRFLTPSVLEPPSSVLNKSTLKPRPRANLLTFAKYVQTLIGAREDPEKTFNFSIKDLYNPYCESLVATAPRAWAAIRLKPDRLNSAVTDLCNVVRNPLKISVKLPVRSEATLVPVQPRAEPPKPASSPSSGSGRSLRVQVPTDLTTSTPPVSPTSPTVSSPLPVPVAHSSSSSTTSVRNSPTTSTQVQSVLRRSNTQMEAALSRVLSVLEPAFRDLNLAGKTLPLRVFDERWLLCCARSLMSDLHKEQMTVDKDGHDVAFRFSFDIGHAFGRADARALRPRIAPSTLPERFALGFALPSFTGLVMLGLHPDSVLADDATLAISVSANSSNEAFFFHDKFRNVTLTQGACHLTAGFLLGWCEECAGVQLGVTEYACKARGDEACRFLLAPLNMIDEKLRLFAKGNSPNLPIYSSTFHNQRRAEPHRTHRRNTSTASAEGGKSEKGGGGWLLSKVPFPLRMRTEESEAQARAAAVMKKIKAGMPVRTDEQIKSQMKQLISSLQRDPAHGKVEIETEKYVAFRATSLSYDFFSLMQQLSGREGEAARQRSHNYAAHMVYTLGRALGRSHQKRLSKTMKLGEHPLEQLGAMAAFLATAGFATVSGAHLLNTQAPHPDGVVLVVDCTNSAEAEAWKQSGANTLVLNGGVCALCAGFITGWLHKGLGLSFASCELTCAALGDATCTFVLADGEAIERVTKQHLTELNLAARANRLRTFPLQAEMSL